MAKLAILGSIVAFLLCACASTPEHEVVYVERPAESPAV